MKKLKPILFFTALLIGVLSCEHEPFPAVPGHCYEDTIYYNRDIQPIFSEYCIKCHNGSYYYEEDDKTITLDLTSYEGLMKYNDDEDDDIIDTEDYRPDQSDLYERINSKVGDDDLMPFGGPKLPDSLIVKIGKWIRQGAQNNQCTDCITDTASITYNSFIHDNLSSCRGCHNPSYSTDRVPLQDYDEVKQAFINRADNKILERIKHSTTMSQEDWMPWGQTNPIPDCYIRQIEIWITNEMPE